MKEKSDGEGGGGGYLRADQIDLKSLDEQLQRHLSRAWTMEKNKKPEDDEEAVAASRSNTPRRQEWEIDPSKLVVKGAIARGTFGAVHRGIYDGQDVAGTALLPHFFFIGIFIFCLGSDCAHLMKINTRS